MEALSVILNLLTSFWISCFLIDLAAAYCPPLFAPETTSLTCRNPEDSQPINCSSSWLPQGTIAHYKCINSTGHELEGLIQCRDEGHVFVDFSDGSNSQLPCGLSRDSSFPEVHIFGYVPAKKFTTPPPNNNIMPEVENATKYERLALGLHNFFRHQHGSPPLMLNFKLSSSAQKWADYLSTQNEFDLPSTNFYGQNLFNSPSLNKLEAVSDAVQNWYHEGMANYRWNNIESNWENSLALNFAQMIWKSTEFFGIGVSNWKKGNVNNINGNGNGTIVVVYYYPTGNIVLEEEDEPEKLFRENVLPINRN